MEAFNKAELVKLAPTELETYENSLKVYRDLKNVIDTARDEGIEQGIEQGRNQKSIEIAKALKKAGISTEIIEKTTGLSRTEIDTL